MPYSPMQLAEAFLKTGELDDALEALNQQLEQEPQDDEARRLRIQVLLRLGTEEHLRQALSDTQSLDLRQNADDAKTQSIIYEKLGLLQDAIGFAAIVCDLEPNNERARERLLELFLKVNAYQDALDLIRQQEQTWRWLEREGDILVFMGDDTMATARYGLVLAKLAEFEGQMRKDYLNALKARVYLARAHAYRRLEQIETAKEHYQAAKQLLPDDPTIDFNLGLLAFLEGDFDSALQQCQDVLERASSHLAESMRDSLKTERGYQKLLEALEA